MAISEQKTYPISVFIIAKNEQDRIPHAIESVKGWVHEVIVIDSGSNDETVSVSKSLGATILYREWEGYGAQKIFGEQQCTQSWILNIDADEAVSPELQQEIQQLFDQNIIDQHHAYHIPIRIISRFANKPPSRFAPSNDPIRLYHREHAGFKDSTIHDSVMPSASCNIGKLRGAMLHRCFRSYRHAVEKINHYSTMQAEHIVQHQRKIPLYRIITEPVIAFLKAYLLRRYCLLGRDGFFESIIYAFARTLRLAKAHELYKQQSMKQHQENAS